MNTVSEVKVKFNDNRLDYLYYKDDGGLEKIKNAASKYEDGVYFFTESKQNVLKQFGFNINE